MKGLEPGSVKIKIPNFLIDRVFRATTNALFDSSVRPYSKKIKAALWSGYNKTLIPYLDLSEYDFDNRLNAQSLRGLNLLNHSEIITTAKAKKLNIKKPLLTLNNKTLDCTILRGLDLSEEEISDNFTTYFTDLRNTGLKISKSIDMLFASMFDGLDLSLTNFNGARLSFTSLKDTNAKIALNELSRYSKDFNLDGCEITDIDNIVSPKVLYFISENSFEKTTITYNNRNYCGQEEIKSLVATIKKEQTQKQIKEAQKVLKPNNK